MISRIEGYFADNEIWWVFNEHYDGVPTEGLCRVRKDGKRELHYAIFVSKDWDDPGYIVLNLYWFEKFLLSIDRGLFELLVGHHMTNEYHSAWYPPWKYRPWHHMVYKLWQKTVGALL